MALSSSLKKASAKILNKLGGNVTLRKITMVVMIRVQVQ